MDDVYCLECDWHGAFSELFNDVSEDADGDMMGEHINACPSCYGQTIDGQDLPDDIDQSYGV